MKRTYDVAAYVWPAYTGDEPRTKTFWPEGFGEWQSVKNSVSKFPGHSWPRRPLWGYVNEADPYVMEMEIEVAADHGVNVFIYDWYWYDGRPFLENCLNDGYLKAKNNERVKFYLMWANHSVNNTWDIRNSHHLEENMIWNGAVERRQFEVIARRLIEKYFKHPSYYTINGKPVFMIYDLQNLITGLGGVGAARDALSWFREQVERAGLPGLHLQLTMWGERKFNLTGIDTKRTATTGEMVEALGFDSLSHYQFIHFTDINRDYNEIMQDVLKEWKRIEKTYRVPYFPHVSIGWDNNPRFKELCPDIITNNTPENVKRMMEHAKEYADNHQDQPPLVTINSWNEWTESSYLQPDNIYGYQYLEAVNEVFCK